MHRLLTLNIQARSFKFSLVIVIIHTGEKLKKHKLKSNMHTGKKPYQTYIGAWHFTYRC